MGKNTAEYMRAYRARKKAARDPDKASWLVGLEEDWRKSLASHQERITELEEEVRRLKTELAERSEDAERWQSTFDRPLPTRKTQQAARDAILRKLNSRPK